MVGNIAGVLLPEKDIQKLISFVYICRPQSEESETYKPIAATLLSSDRCNETPQTANAKQEFHWNELCKISSLFPIPCYNDDAAIADYIIKGDFLIVQSHLNKNNNFLNPILPAIRADFFDYFLVSEKLGLLAPQQCRLPWKISNYPSYYRNNSLPHNKYR